MSTEDRSCHGNDCYSRIDFLVNEKSDSLWDKTPL